MVAPGRVAARGLLRTLVTTEKPEGRNDEANVRARVTAGVLCGLAMACSPGPQQDASSNPPAVRPPVQAALPQGLLVGGSTFAANVAPSPGSTGTSRSALESPDYTRTCQTDVTTDACMTLSGTARLQCIVKQRLFCGGPTEVLRLLDALDSRMTELEARTDGSEACRSAAPAERSSDLVFPGGTSFEHYLQCRDSNIGLGFGVKDGQWYLREALGAGGWLFRADQTGEVAGYVWLPSPDGSFNMSTGILQVQASRVAGTVELTGGGVGFGFCALHYRSDASHIWIQINPDGVGMSCDSDSSGSADAADYSELCLDSASLSPVDGAQCAAVKAGRSLTLLGRGPTSGGGRSFEGAPAPDSEPIVTTDLNDLTALFNAAADMSGIAELGK